MTSRKTWLIAGGAAALLVGGALIPKVWNAHQIDKIVQKNLDARGGADAWAAVHTLQMTGRMDLGQGMVVPYELTQQVPGKMRLEYSFGGDRVVQTARPGEGWKLQPYKGRLDAQPMDESELADTLASSDPRGLLIDHRARGIGIRIDGSSTLNGHPTHKLELTLPGGAKRWLHIDQDTGLDLRLESTRVLGGKELVVQTDYSDWKETEGLRVARLQTTRTHGDPDSHFLTVDTIQVNVEVAPQRFERPAPAVAKAKPDPRELAKLPPGTRP